MSRRATEGSGEEPADRKAFLLRISPDLMTELRGWAAQDLRSLNAHIEFLLRDAVRRRKGDAPSADGSKRRG